MPLVIVVGNREVKNGPRSSSKEDGILSYLEGGGEEPQPAYSFLAFN